jgi:hypothetical protein
MRKRIAEANKRAREARRRRRQSLALKRRWADPELRDKWVSAMRINAADPEVLARRREGMNTPEAQAKRKASWDRRLMRRWRLLPDELAMFRVLRAKLNSPGLAAAAIKRSRKQQEARDEGDGGRRAVAHVPAGRGAGGVAADARLLSAESAVPRSGGARAAGDRRDRRADPPAADARRPPLAGCLPRDV